MKNPWIVSFPRAISADHRLFCFPYAGGSAHLFRSWSDMLPSGIEIVAIQTPGTGSRLLDPPCTKLDDVVAGVLDAIRPLLDEKPFSFFGHSKGALIAFELAGELQQRNLPLPEHLFLSANPAPWTRMPEQAYAHLSDAEFIDRLKDLNGTPPGVFNEPELLELMLPGLRADFMLGDGYSYARTSKLVVPTTVFAGEHDEIESHQIFGWQDAIANEIRVESIPGGHFFIHSHLERLTALITKQLNSSINRQERIVEKTSANAFMPTQLAAGRHSSISRID